MAIKDPKRRAALLSLLSALVLTIIKLAVGISTNSLGILSEALHSGLDLLATGLTLWAVYVAAKPADSHHTFGHGKAENLSALAQTLLLFGTCGWVAFEGIERLMHGEKQVEPSILAIGVMLLSIAIDINRVIALKRVARASKSQALEADALHFSSDIFASGVVLMGVLISYLAKLFNASPKMQFYLSQADTVAALIVAILIFVTSLRIIRDAIDTLMDATPLNVSQAIKKAILKVPGVLSCKDLRIRQSGAQFFVELRLGVWHEQSFSAAHGITRACEASVMSIVPDADVIVHIVPESLPEVTSPFTLIQTQAAGHGLKIHNIMLFGEEEPYHLEYHVEVESTLDLREANKLIKAFEDELKVKFPNLTIVSHIEPDLLKGQTSRPLNIALSDALCHEVEQIVCKDTAIDNLHDLVIFDLYDSGPCLSFHCNINKQLNVLEAHNLCTSLEKQIINAIPNIYRVNIHLEPTV